MKENRIKIIAYLLVLVLFAGALAFLSRRDVTREETTLANAIEKDISAYYARNGYYPADMDVLRDTYGLTYDEERFFVGYGLRGANIRPYVTVVEVGK